MSDRNNMKLFTLNSNHEIAQRLRIQLVYLLGNYPLDNFLTAKSRSTSKKVSVVTMFTLSSQPATLLATT